MMSLLDFILGERKKTASVAKERLQILLAHERSGADSATPDYLPALQKELIEVIGKYINIRPDDIQVNHVRRDGEDQVELLEVKIDLPNHAT